MSTKRRTITEVLDLETGECIDANQFFQKPLDEISKYRSELQQVIENYRHDPLFVCYYCKQNIRIRGGIGSSKKRKSDILHFAHLKDSDECHIKTKNQYTREEVDRIKYNGAKESKLHIELKDKIAECLGLNEETKGEVNSIQIEKVIKDNKVNTEWRKPDINAVFLNKRIAIELQLSTTWLDVITKRQHFYKENGIYIFWMFHQFNTNDEARKLTYDDVIYTNNQNAYVFDEESYEISKAKGDFVFKCYYKTYRHNEGNIIEHWKYSTIRLTDLTFNENVFKIFFYDSGVEKLKAEKELHEYSEQQERELRLKELEAEKNGEKRRKLDAELLEVDKKIEGVKMEQRALERAMGELGRVTSGISEIVNQVMEHFMGIYNFQPMYHNDELMIVLEKKYATKLKRAVNSIEENIPRKQKLEKKLTDFYALSVVSIDGISYRSVSDWKFIMGNYKKFRTIKKHLVNDLFAMDGLKEINDEKELNRLRLSQDTLFLIDFSEEIGRLEEQQVEIKQRIEQSEVVITLAKTEIYEFIQQYSEQNMPVFKVMLDEHKEEEKNLFLLVTSLKEEINLLED